MPDPIRPTKGHEIMADHPKIHDIRAKFMDLPDHVHAYVIELPDAVVVVDATIAESSASEVRTVAESLGKPIEGLLMTHGHPDHYTGLVKFADVPRYASQGCLDFAHHEDIAKSSVAKGYLGADYPDVRVFPDRIVRDGEVVRLGGVDFTFTDLGPGESDADGMWTFAQQGVKYAFVGDAIANHTHCFMRDLHALEWLKILERLDRELDSSTRIYVGHGDVPAPLETIAWQRGYIETFLDAVGRIEDRSLPVARATQEKVIAAMKGYLPGDATMFLLDYELDVTIPAMWEKLAPVAG
jgi:glyoxylase-like metal-dependent hydrolase (beta-lactamase superfamily II)